MDSDSSSDQGESESREVPSLQKSSLRYIARHVREFPVWHLASLPKRLRIDVLRFLPAVEICRLEEGPVCADIDMEFEVWDTVCEIRLSWAPTHVRNQLEQLGSAGVSGSFSWEDDSSLKTQYFDVVTGCLFASYSKSKLAAYHLLYHAPETAQSSGFTADTFSDVEMLHILMEQCHFSPSLVNIAVGSLISSTLWLNKTESFTVLAAFFTCLSRLNISVEPRWGEDSDSLVKFRDVFRFVLEAVFLETCRQPALTHLVVKLGDGVMISGLDHLADFVSSRTGGLAKYACSPLVTGYSGLTFLSMELSGDAESIGILSEPHTNARLIVEQQSDLCSLHLSGLAGDGGGTVCREYDQLMQCISELFRGPQFVKLELSGGLCHSSGDHTITFKKLMHEFLSAPVKGQELVLGIYGVSLNDCSSFCERSFANFAPDVVGSKHLNIQTVEAEQWVNPYFEQCLAHFPFQTLGTITLQEVEYLNDEALAAIASLNLHSLHVIDTELMLDVSVEAVAQLFSMPHLTTLTLTSVAIMGIDNFGTPNVWTLFAEAVTSGLRQQASIAQLNSLDLSGNFLTRVGSDSLKAMFDAIFTLPQLSSLILELQDNYFTVAQLKLLCKCWGKKAGGHRLEMLNVRKQQPQKRHTGHLGIVPVGLRNLAVFVL